MAFAIHMTEKIFYISLIYNIGIVSNSFFFTGKLLLISHIHWNLISTKMDLAFISQSEKFGYFFIF